MTVISNATPLINLSVIGLLDLLHTLFGTIIIPEAVYQEVVVDGQGRPGAAEVSNASWIMRQAVTDQQAVQQLMNGTSLKRGESEVIILATELPPDYLILDDLAARRYARKNQLPMIGTVGVVLAAKAQHLIASVKQPLDALRAAGKYIHDDVYNEALRRAGE